ncbi:hypothetical protein SCHPADRAFT_936905 [Schizopora paradoxa]|uniref:Uncharacterized protein n=1 Tax=Schizopora paradoxa TaxID=27342 RepID=A0A0H2RZL4_9AGAM|nr:hypothetical protein SCHPADRAFT_936905 [Schizopora paradoxa]
MSATSRAEARRKAILSRGSDRLNKLTTSARGEDHPAYNENAPPAAKLPTDTFLGDELIMPTPPATSSPAPHEQMASDALGSESGIPVELQQEFIRALMGSGGMGMPPPGIDQPQASDPMFNNEDPMAAMMNALSQLTGQAPGGMPGAPPSAGQSVQPPRPKTTLQKLLPVMHLFATWILLGFFVAFKEPEVYAEKPHAMVGQGIWQRWGELNWRKESSILGVQPVAFFWSFVTLQLGLHSVQIFTKSNPVQLPSLLAMALPHLPPTLSFVITNAFSYARMVGSLLDDLAGLVVGIGLVIWCATIVPGWQ